MTCLIVCLTTGKGTWTQVSSLINAAPWEKIFLVTGDYGLKFKSEKPMEFVVINPDGPLEEIRDVVMQYLKGKIIDTEVALNLASGTGKEHMAVISAVLKLGFGIRLVASKNGKLVEI